MSKKKNEQIRLGLALSRGVAFDVSLAVATIICVHWLGDDVSILELTEQASELNLDERRRPRVANYQ